MAPAISGRASSRALRVLGAAGRGEGRTFLLHAAGSRGTTRSLHGSLAQIGAQYPDSGTDRRRRHIPSGPTRRILRIALFWGSCRSRGSGVLRGPSHRCAQNDCVQAQFRPPRRNTCYSENANGATNRPAMFWSPRENAVQCLNH